MHKISILVLSCLFICFKPKFTNGVKMPFLSNEEHRKFSVLLKKEVRKAFPSDGDDSADIVIQEADAKRNVTFYKFGETKKPVFLSTGKKNVGQNVVVLLRGDDYIDQMNKKKFVVLRKRGSGNEYNVHLAHIWLDYNNAPNVVFENVEISILPSVSKLIAYLHEAFGSYGLRNKKKTKSLRPKCGWFGFNLLCDNGEKLKLGDLGSLFPSTSSFGWYGEKSEENDDGLSGDNKGGSIGSGGSGNGGSETGGGDSNNGAGGGKGSSGAAGGHTDSGASVANEGSGKGTSGASGANGGSGKGSSGASGGHKDSGTGSSGAAGGHKDSGTGSANAGSGKGSSGGAGGHKDSGTGTSGSGGGKGGGGSGNDISFDDMGNDANDEAEYFVKLKGEEAPGTISQKKTA